MVRSAAPTSLIEGGGGLLEEHKIGKKRTVWDVLCDFNEVKIWSIECLICNFVGQPHDFFSLKEQKNHTIRSNLTAPTAPETIDSCRPTNWVVMSLVKIHQASKSEVSCCHKPFNQKRIYALPAAVGAVRRRRSRSAPVETSPADRHSIPIRRRRGWKNDTVPGGDPRVTLAYHRPWRTTHLHGH